VTNILFLNDSPFVRLGLAAGFQQLGHDVSFLPRLWELAPDEQRRAARRRLETHPRADIVMYEGFTGSRPIAPAAIRELTVGWSAAFFYWAIEDPLWTHEVLSPSGTPGPYAQVADHLFTTAAECVPRYEAAGIRSSVLQFGCNPEFHAPVAIEANLRCDVLLVASYYPSRGRVQFETVLGPAVSYCRRRQLECRVYGHGWDRLPHDWPPLDGRNDVIQGPLPYELLPAAYAGAQVVLGAEQCLNRSVTQSSTRIFEVLSCSGCYLGPRHRAHSRLFSDRHEALFSDSSTETTDLLDWVMNDDDARLRIARAGRKRCLSAHTYAHRAQQVLERYDALTALGA
jgi:spore maturation protein CgeB